MSYEKNDLGYDLGYDVEGLGVSEVSQEVRCQPEGVSLVYRMNDFQLRSNYGKPAGLKGFGVSLNNPAAPKVEEKGNQVQDPFAPTDSAVSGADAQAKLAATQQAKPEVAPVFDDVETITVAEHKAAVEQKKASSPNAGQAQPEQPKLTLRERMKARQAARAERREARQAARLAKANGGVPVVKAKSDQQIQAETAKPPQAPAPALANRAKVGEVAKLSDVVPKGPGISMDVKTNDRPMYADAAGVADMVPPIHFGIQGGFQPVVAPPVALAAEAGVAPAPAATTTTSTSTASASTSTSVSASNGTVATHTSVTADAQSTVNAGAPAEAAEQPVAVPTPPAPGAEDAAPVEAPTVDPAAQAAALAGANPTAPTVTDPAGGEYQFVVGPQGKIYPPGNIDPRDRDAFIQGASEYAQANAGLPAKDLNVGALQAGNARVAEFQEVRGLGAAEVKFITEQKLHEDLQARQVYETGKATWKELYKQEVARGNPAFADLTPKQQEEYAQIAGQAAVSKLREETRPYEGLPPEIVGSSEAIETFHDTRRKYFSDPANAGQDPATRNKNSYDAAKTAAINEANKLDEQKRSQADFMKNLFMMVAQAVVQAIAQKAAQKPDPVMMAMQMGQQLISANMYKGSGMPPRR